MTGEDQRELGGNLWQLGSEPEKSRQRLSGHRSCDVVVVGAGYTGLWTAYELIGRRPGIEVVIVEAQGVGAAASGRNGGWIESTITHGISNGEMHFGTENRVLDRIGRDTYQGIVATLDAERIDCDFEPVGMLDLVTNHHHLEDLERWAEIHEQYGHRVERLDQATIQEYLRSPLGLAALRRPDSGGLVHPLKLCEGLAQAVERRGIPIYERSRVSSIKKHGHRVTVETRNGSVQADHVVIAANASTGDLVKSSRRRYLPVYDYLCATRPLTKSELDSIGWHRREGSGDTNNLFHSFRLTPDNRVFFGGYRPRYPPGGRMRSDFDHHDPTYALLRRHFEAFFPQLCGVPFTHRWSGAVTVTSRFTPTFGTVADGSVHFALGYTGLGLVTTRFASQVLADYITEPSSDRLQLGYVQRAPIPFPPDPLRRLAVSTIQRHLARHDQTGKRSMMLATLDRLGIGFAS